MAEFGLSAYDAGVLVADRETADFYEAVATGRDAKTAANWVISNLFGALNKKGLGIAESPVSAENLGRLLDLIAADTISGRIAKEVFEVMVETGGDPGSIVEEKGLRQITDTAQVEAVIDTVIAENPVQVAKVRGGNEKITGWFVGQVMKATGGKANPKLVGELLTEKLRN